MRARSPFAGSRVIHVGDEVCAGLLPTLLPLGSFLGSSAVISAALAASFPTRCTNDGEGGLKAGAFKVGLSACGHAHFGGEQANFCLD